MNLKSKTILICLMAMVLLVYVYCIIEVSHAEKEEISFNVIDSGDQSGYSEEDYFVVRNEDEWVEVWKKHSAPQMASSCPEISFQDYMVICVFMGEQPTTGYGISIESVYEEDEKAHVEVSKWFPKEGVLVGQALTYPYVLASIEKLDSEIIFNISVGNGTINEPVLHEFSMTLLVAGLTILCIVIIVLARNTRKHTILV